VSTKLKSKEQKKLKIEKFNVNNERKNVVDVCTILDKCSIDEISKYLLNQGKKKRFSRYNKKTIINYEKT